MDDGNRLGDSERVQDRPVVQDVALDESAQPVVIRAHGVLVPARKVVEGDGVEAGTAQGLANVGSDVAGAARDNYVHASPSCSFGS